MGNKSQRRHQRNSSDSGLTFASINKSEKWNHSFTTKMEFATTLKRQATRLIAEIQKDRNPVLITEHGRPAAYLVDVQTFGEQQSRIEILEGIADYIALDKPDPARRYVQRVFEAVERLAHFPKSGYVPPEIPHLPYRQLAIPPCLVFYRSEGKAILIVFVMRSKQRLHEDDLKERE